MEACVLHAIGDLRWGEAPTPEPGPGQALVRVAAAGLCGSDMPRIFEKGSYRLPIIPGHELSGRVVSAPDRPDLAPGDPVVVFPIIPCGECEYCHAGLTQLCDDYGYLGSRGDGGFAQYVAAPAANLLALPAGCDVELAALVEPAAVALHALRRGGVKAGDAVWVIGAGPVGLLLAQWARLLGATTVLVTDIDDAKLALAGKWADATLNTREVSPTAWVLEHTAGRGADVVVEAVGVAATIAQAGPATRKRGTVVLMGNPAGDLVIPQQPYWQVLRRELTLVGTWNSLCTPDADGDWGDVVAAVADGRLDLAPLVSHRVGLRELPPLLQRLHAGQEGYVKVLAVP